jgi:transcription antitermination factor NusG
MVSIAMVMAERRCGERWYVARTKARHEKKVAEMLAACEVDHCLPVYEAVHRWNDRSVRVNLPLFPGYVFLHMAYVDRMLALQVPGVVGFVKFGDTPAELTTSDISNLEILRRGAGSEGTEPFPYLQVGKRVRVASGPFAGLVGVLKRKKGADRLVISVHQIQRSVSVEISGAEVYPICLS